MSYLIFIASKDNEGNQNIRIVLRLQKIIRFI